MSEAEQSAPHITVSAPYTDAAGHRHVSFAVSMANGKTIRGEAVYDGRLDRTVIDRESTPPLGREVEVAVKRAVAAACQQGAAEQ